jgi:hypothetical protein
MYIIMNSPSSLPCNSKNPMYCTGDGLARLYRESKSLLPAQTLINSPDLEIKDGVNWSFDQDTMTIWNNRYWKGFYPADYDYKNLILMYGFGFYKKFWPDKENRKVKGETHPFNTDIHAANEAVDMEIPEKGKGVYIKYSDFPFNSFDDLIKIVDRDTVLGEASVSVRNPGRGIPIFHFVLSRRYSLDFMTRADCRFIFQSKAKDAETGKVLGVWDLLLVSNAALSQPILRIKFHKDGGGPKVGIIQYGNLPNKSQIRAFDEKLARTIDLPAKIQNGSIRAAGKDYLVGILEASEHPIFEAMRGSEGFITKEKDGLFLPYVLKRVASPGGTIAKSNETRK